MTSDEHRLLLAVLQACSDASDAILDIYQNEDFEVETKQDKSPLTEADMASHHILVAALKELTPDIPILSEESADIDFEQRREWSRLWVVDPLDGTREFIKRNGEFTINIALIDDHVPVLGVIAVPVSRTAYTGIVGEGAQRWRDYRTPEPIRTRRPCARPPVVLGSRSHANPRTQAYFDMLGEHERASRGSATGGLGLVSGQMINL
ncbi:MAG: 3'(2'),5'-bisphosphate nucleotidase CysQ, partial [Wenzhouxiangellaceae bacterium]